MFSLGTETDGLFRTRSGGHYWPNHFLQELRTMVASVRAVYDGLVTYDMDHGAYSHDFFAPGSRHLWEDLDLDVIGVSAWFPVVDESPTMVLSVESLRQEYERIFRDYLIPVAAMNERPIVFLEYGIVDTVDDPADPAGFPDDPRVPFSDMNGNGLDDGQEQQANVIEAVLGTASAYPGVVYGAFFWDNWISSNEQWASIVEDGERTYSFRGKLGEHVVRARYDQFRSLLWLPVRTLYVGDGAHVVPVELPNASTYMASSSAPDVATVTVSGSRVAVSPVAEGVASVTVTGDGAADTLQFTVVVRDLEAERAALEALYRATDGDDWTNNANWLTDAPFEEWYGVEVDETGHVTGLRLGGWDESVRDFVGNGLVGALPPELGGLAHLRRLSIEGNELAGPIPAELGQLTELRQLYLGSNGLTGPVPATLSNLTNLQGLNLGGNALTGRIPATLANLTSLEWLSLWGDAWTSEPAPEWVGELTNLTGAGSGRPSVYRSDSGHVAEPRQTRGPVPVGQCADGVDSGVVRLAREAAHPESQRQPSDGSNPCKPDPPVGSRGVRHRGHRRLRARRSSDSRLVGCDRGFPFLGAYLRGVSARGGGNPAGPDAGTGRHAGRGRVAGVYRSRRRPADLHRVVVGAPRGDGGGGRCPGAGDGDGGRYGDDPGDGDGPRRSERDPVVHGDGDPSSEPPAGVGGQAGAPDDRGGRVAGDSRGVGGVPGSGTATR